MPARKFRSGTLVVYCWSGMGMNVEINDVEEISSGSETALYTHEEEQ